MTSIELTSGEILDIVDAIRDKETEALNKELMHLSGYYHNLAESFQPILDKLQELPGEQRVARLVMAL